MKEKVELVVRANDYSTEDLKALYIRNRDALVLDEKASNSKIEDSIRDCKGAVMMLGHGTENGLLGVLNLETFDSNRFLISSRHVQFLRGKTCVGIWCNANIFAGKYGLTGLFSGMVVSEFEEAVMLSIQADKDEILAHNYIWSGDLSYCLANYDLKDVPAGMLERDKWHTPLTEFNYSSLYYFENGEELL